MVMVVVLAWVLVGIGCWVGYQIVQQNGRILLHLESLERQLADLKLKGTQQPQAPPTIPAGLPLGSPAPEFELPDLANHQRKLSEWRGRHLLLIFFNPGCGFCAQMAPDIAALPFDDKDKPIPLLVSTGSLDGNRKLMEKHGIRCPVLLQKQMEIASTYAVSGTPIGYLIDAQGNIASDIAIGAPALLEAASNPMAIQEQAAKPLAEHVAPKIGHDLTNSKIKRDGLSVGTPAPAFRLPRLEGGELALEDFRGRKVLLIFSDPECSPCQQLFGRLSQVWSPKFQVQILMVSRGSREANQAKVQEHMLTFPIVLQKQWEISRLYAMFATPIAYLIDEQGVIASNMVTGPDSILDLLAGASSLVTHEAARMA